jgi:DNA-directed RNA polymerase subunit RPC12/RpoP
MKLFNKTKKEECIECFNTKKVFDGTDYIACPKCSKKKKDLIKYLDKVNRVEVIDDTGRAYVIWDDNISVSLSLQDDNRTLKLFINT